MIHCLSRLEGVTRLVSRWRVSCLRQDNGCEPSMFPVDETTVLPTLPPIMSPLCNARSPLRPCTSTNAKQTQINSRISSPTRSLLFGTLQLTLGVCRDTLTIADVPSLHPGARTRRIDNVDEAHVARIKGRLTTTLKTGVKATLAPPRYDPLSCTTIYCSEQLSSSSDIVTTYIDRKSVV